MNKPTSKTKQTQTSTIQKSKTVQASAPRPIQDISNPRPIATVMPAHKEIAMRAYEIYIERGCPQGQSEQIWHQAEQEIQGRGQIGFLSE